MQPISSQDGLDIQKPVLNLNQIKILLKQSKLSAIKYQDNAVIEANQSAKDLFNEHGLSEIVGVAYDKLFSNEACELLNQLLTKQPISELEVVGQLKLIDQVNVFAWVMSTTQDGQACMQLIWDPTTVISLDKAFNHADVITTPPAFKEEQVHLVLEALKFKRLKLFFQPIACLTGGLSAHYDVLLRLYTAEDREVFAGEFMIDIEKHPVAVKIDQWVILQAIKQLLVYQCEIKKACLLIHLSYATMEDSLFIDWLSTIIEKSKINPASLIFQIDTKYITTNRSLVEKLNSELSRLGCRISICHFHAVDDISSFLDNIKCHYIKLHNNFTQELADNRSYESEIKTMVFALHAKQLKIIVPYVETPQVMTQLWRCGIDYIQGYFLQKPKSKMDYDFSSEY